MPNPKKKNLERLLHLIDELCSIEENEWFKDSLASRFSNNSGDFEDFPSFLRYQKNQFRLKGRSFYRSITNAKLKQELIDDYVEMSWNQSINNLDRFMLFAFYQMENLLNYYLIISNSFEKIKMNKDYYTHEYAPNFIVVVYDNFYIREEKKNIESISIWGKLTYWMYDADVVKWEGKNHGNISNLINIRNANSHRSSQSDKHYVMSTIDTLKKSDFSSLSYYINVLRKILESFKSINPTVKNLETKNERPRLSGVKQVGRIDLDQFRK